jgi:hypothetical protein
MGRTKNSEKKVECPIEGCDTETLARGLYMHIYQTDDAEQEGHYPRFEVPDSIDEDEIKITGNEEVEMDFPDTVDLEDRKYLDTYTGKAYQGKRGLMIHLGQMAGQDNIPEDVTAKHDAEDFPIVEIDHDGNITEVVKWPSGNVPPIEPYLPWFDDEHEGYIEKSKVKNVIEEIEDTDTGVIAASKLKERLLDE